MDEPMEAEADSTQPELGQETNSHNEEHPLLRPGSMGMYLQMCNVVCLE